MIQLQATCNRPHEVKPLLAASGTKQTRSTRGCLAQTARLTLLETQTCPTLTVLLRLLR